MLAQDPVTGQLYEVPDNQPYGTGYAEAPTMMYDGLGNPVGWAFLAPLAAKLAAKALPVVAKYAAPLAKRFYRLSRGQQAAWATVRATGRTSSSGQEASVARAFAPPVQPVPVQPVLPVEPVPYMPAPMPPSTEGEYGPIEEQYGQYAPRTHADAPASTDGTTHTADAWPVSVQTTAATAILPRTPTGRLDNPGASVHRGAPATSLSALLRMAGSEGSRADDGHSTRGTRCGSAIDGASSTPPGPARAYGRRPRGRGGRGRR